MIISPVSFKYTSNVSFGKKSTKEKKPEPFLGSPEYCAKKIIGGGSRFAIAVVMLLLTALLTRGCQKTDEAPKVTTELPSLTEIFNQTSTALEGHDGQTAGPVAETDDNKS